MGVDFKKLNDPVWREQMRVEREAAEAKAAAHEKMLRRELNLCQEACETLAENERSLVRNCQQRLNSYLPLSEKQEKWLLDIASRVRKELDVKVQALIDKHANGNELGEHLTHPRGNWPLAEECADSPRDYWFWVLRVVAIYGDEVSA
jgi:hypothetical protein